MFEWNWLDVFCWWIELYDMNWYSYSFLSIPPLPLFFFFVFSSPLIFLLPLFSSFLFFHFSSSSLLLPPLLSYPIHPSSPHISFPSPLLPSPLLFTSPYPTHLTSPLFSYSHLFSPLFSYSHLSSPLLSLLLHLITTKQTIKPTNQ